MEQLLNLEREEENRKVGMLGSIAVHLLLLLICLLPFFSYHQPPEQESGILVSFGMEDADSDVEKESQIEMEEEVRPETEAQPTKSTEKSVESETKPKTSSVPEAVVSEDTQDESVITATQEKESQQTLDEARELREKEAARLAAEAAAEAAEAKRKEEEYQKSKKSYSDLFSSGAGSNDNSGDEGDPSGEPDSDILDRISTGNGKIGGGLSTRDLLYEPVVNDNSQKTGKVVVKVCVDASGKVSEAEFTQKGSTTTDSYLVKKAIQGAKKYKFNLADKDLQCGTITFDFRLQ